MIIMTENNEEYDLVCKSNLFNHNYYNEKYNLDIDSPDEALTHYLEIGYKMGYNPNEYFDGNEYLNTHLNVKKANMNPLVHYLKCRKNAEKDSKKRILYVLHYSGGVEYTVKDIAESVSDEYECFILKSDMEKLMLSHIENDDSVTLEEFELACPWHSKLIHSEEFKEIYFHILFNYNIDLINIEHLLFHSLDLPYISETLNIPTVLTIHDYYYICPIFVLLDENYKYCGGYCNTKDKNCSVILEWFKLPENIVEWKKEWQKEMKIIFEKCDAIITSMPFTKNMFLKHYPTLKESDIQLIEPGRDFIRYDNLNSTPGMNQPIKILVPGLLLPHKGSEFIKDLKKIDVNNRLELHFLGLLDEGLEEIGTNHGEYERKDFAKYVKQIRPSFMGLFSITPETYSCTLTESLSVGVPVIASDVGVLKERVEKNDCGWLIDTHNPEEAYQKILEIASDKNEYGRVKKQINMLKLKTADEMASDYKKLYEKLFDGI